VWLPVVTVAAFPYLSWASNNFDEEFRTDGPAAHVGSDLSWNKVVEHNFFAATGTRVLLSLASGLSNVCQQHYFPLFRTRHV
jgi:hypothetical protein